MNDDCNPHGIERPSFLLRALDELDASMQRHPANRRRRNHVDDEYPEYHDNVIPLFPEK